MDPVEQRRGDQNNESWVTTGYISDPISTENNIRIPDIHEIIFETLKKVVPGAYVEEVQEDEHIRRKTYLASYEYPTLFRWKVNLNIEVERYKYLVLTMDPEKLNARLIPDKATVSDLSSKDVPKLIDTIGNSISIDYNDFPITFKNISGTHAEFADIGSWPVQISASQQVLYRKLFEERDSYLSEVTSNSLNLQIVNLTSTDSEDIKRSISHIKNLGSVDEEILDHSYVRSIPMQNFATSKMYVILTESQSDYEESRKWFLRREIPFQHIRQISKFNQWASIRTMAKLEMLKKMDVQTQYLRPDPTSTWLNTGIMYIADVFAKDKVANKRFLQISYTYPDDRSYTGEKVCLYDKNEIDFYANRNYLAINDTEALARKISRDEDELVGSSIDVIVSKEMKSENIQKIVQDLAERNISVRRVYFVSNFKSRIADNYCTLDNDPWIHPFYKLTGKVAMVKNATRLLLFPQLFNTYIKVIYPDDAEIGFTDISKIVWLAKKRIYRIYNLPNITQLEPINIFEHNREIFTEVEVYTYWLRFLI